MNKPLCYYVNFRYDDDSYILDLQKLFGSSLENLTKREQLFLLYDLASRLCCYEKGEIRTEVFTASRYAQGRLTASDQEGLCEALINQVRWGCHEQVHNS